MVIERYYCLNCFEDFEVDVTEVAEAVQKIKEFKNSEFSIVHLEVGCPHCGINACFNIDEKMIPVIRFLNERGYETGAHCSGHLKRTPFHFKCTHPMGAYLTVYITEEEKEVIKDIPSNPHLEVEFHKEVFDPDMTDPDNCSRDMVCIYFVPRVTSEEKMDEWVKELLDYISQFPESNSMEKYSFVNVEMEDD